MKNDLLIKVGQKEHIESFINGNVYFNTLGHFKKYEDNFRGDNDEGILNLNKEEVLQGKVPLEKRIKDNIPYIDRVEFQTGFEGTDSNFIFCASMLDETNHQIVDEKICFTYSFYKEITQFGQYAVIFQEDLFTKKLNEALNGYGDNIYYRKIKYIDKKQQNSFNSKIGAVDICFVKDVSYKNQNEWRYMITNNKEVLNSNDVGGFQVKIKDLPTSEIINLHTLVRKIKI